MENTDGSSFQVLVTNLDTKLELHRLIQLLLSSLKQFVNVLYLTVSLEKGVVTKAIAGVACHRDAEYAMFELQGEFIGCRRVYVSYFPAERDVFENLKSHTPISSSKFCECTDISILDDNKCFLVYMNGDYFGSELSEDQNSQNQKEIVLSNHLQLLVNDMTLLLEEYGEIPLNSFDDFFQKKFGIPVCSDIYGFPDLRSLMEYFKDYFSIRNRQQIWSVCLNTEIGSSEELY